MRRYRPPGTEFPWTGHATGPARPIRPKWSARYSRNWSLGGNEAVVVAKRTQPRLGRLGRIASGKRPETQPVRGFTRCSGMLYIRVGHGSADEEHPPNQGVPGGNEA